MDRPIAATAGKDFEDGCHCGQVRIRATGPLREILMCHCSDCLKFTGTSWDASAVHAGDFSWLGDGRPRWYGSSEWAGRDSARPAGRRCSTVAATCR